jgi:hypothetical protein
MDVRWRVWTSEHCGLTTVFLLSSEEKGVSGRSGRCREVGAGRALLLDLAVARRKLPR